MSHGSRYPPRSGGGGGGGGGRPEYDSYGGRRDQYRDRDRDGRDRHYDRDLSRRASPPRGSGGDSYRPPSYSHRDNLYNSQDTRQQSSSQYDSWAPGTAGTDGYRPPGNLQPPPPLSLPREEIRPPQSGFTFRVDKPAGVQESYDSYRPNEGAYQQYGQNASSHMSAYPQNGPSHTSYRPPASTRRGRGRDGRGGRGGFVRFKAAERPMLNPLRTTGPEQVFFDADAEATYRPLVELSDSDEAEMDISEGEGNDTTSHEPSSKRARLVGQQSASDNAVPKWSNPDPYTALPPPDAAARQRKDVVQLIRKARVESKESKASIPAEVEEFIPCDFDDTDDGSDVEIIEVKPAHREDVTVPDVPTNAPTGPRSGRTSQQTLPSQPAPQNYNPTQPKFDKQPVSGRSNENTLGSRKRTHDDEIKLPAHAKLKKANKMPVGGNLVYEWKLKDGENPRPWLVTDHSQSNHMGNWLHKEVVDFYDHIKPRDFEENIRAELVEQLKTLCRTVYKDAEVYPFGSFPSGLYLPTGDMDLVLCSDSILNGSGAKYANSRALFTLRSTLVNSGFALPGQVELILKARVPLVKFIDSRTGLKVDVSFENLTGIQAIETFRAWKRQYPSMPILVTLIKHFLAMRGLNEPVNGGIGGFSVICLVVSMLQQNPAVQSRSMKPEHYLGDLLMDFFDLYGNRFNYQTTAISLNPPAYIPKNRVAGFTYKNVDRLSIIDPNNSANDISGGSANIATITTLFAEAHRDLRERMASLAKADKSARRGASILEVIFAGDYSTFRLQRAHLEKLAERGLGPVPEVKKPPKRSPW